MSRPRRFSDDERAEIRIMRERGASLKEIAYAYKASIATVFNTLNPVMKKPARKDWYDDVIARLDRIERKLEERKGERESRW